MRPPKKIKRQPTGDYDVGFAAPPEQPRYQTGQPSACPDGGWATKRRKAAERAAGELDYDDAIHKYLYKKIRVDLDGRWRWLPLVEIIARNLVIAAFTNFAARREVERSQERRRQRGLHTKSRVGAIALRRPSPEPDAETKRKVRKAGARKARTHQISMDDAIHKYLHKKMFLEGQGRWILPIDLLARLTVGAAAKDPAARRDVDRSQERRERRLQQAKQHPVGAVVLPEPSRSTEEWIREVDAMRQPLDPLEGLPGIDRSKLRTPHRRGLTPDDHLDAGETETEDD